MDLISLCALRVFGFVYMSPAGTYAQTVVAKATYELRPGESVLALEQDEPNEEDNHWNDDPARSVYAPSDRVPYKPKADVILVGHAFAPGKKPVRSLMVRLVVGEIDKSIEVWCDRGFTLQNGQLLEGPAFTKMSLRWERAAGGPETNNPVGTRFDGAPDRYGMVAIPNLQPPGIYVSQRSDTFSPVCFAPVADSWPGRMQKLGRHVGAFLANDWRSRPLPDDFNYGYFQVAPPDQQASELRSNERIVLENLHPQYERLVTSLPGSRPRAIVDRAMGEREEIRLVADTLWIDTDRGLCTVVWRGRIGLRHSQEAGRVMIWVDGLPVRSTAGAIPTVENSQEWLGDGTTTLLTRHDALMGSVLPFENNQPELPLLVGTVQSTAPAWLGPLANVALDDTTGTLVGPMAGSAKDPLPFANTAIRSQDMPSELLASQLIVRLGDNDPTGTIVAGLKPSGLQTEEIFPFQSPAAQRSPLRPMLIPVPDPTVLEGPRTQEPPRGLTINELVCEAEPSEVLPPPMLGPLANSERAGSNKVPLVVMPQTNEEGTPEIENLTIPSERKPKPEDFSLERCASLTARIARRKADKARVLVEEELSPEYWAAIEKHWTDAIRLETKNGGKTMLERFDAAYIAELEKERGSIRVEEYAKLTLAAERGTTDDVLAELGLPRGVVMRLERTWMKKIATDATFRERTAEAINALRNV